MIVCLQVFAVLLLAGLTLAEPESNPGYGYGGYGYGHSYGGYYGYPGYGYGGYYRGKRDAEADPAVLASSSSLTAPQQVHPYAAAYGYGLPYAGHHAIPHAYTVSAPAVTNTVPGVTYTHPAAHVYHAGKYFLHEFLLFFYNFYKPCLFYLLLLIRCARPTVTKGQLISKCP